MNSIDELKGYILYLKAKKLSRGLTEYENIKYDQYKKELETIEKIEKDKSKLKVLSA